ncbi:MAG TPA: hypothetical protein VGF15_07085 [Solirubrobacteraceae bacterium]
MAASAAVSPCSRTRDFQGEVEDHRAPIVIASATVTLARDSHDSAPADPQGS